MSNPKKQHYIPRAHIEQFLDEAGKFWFCDLQNKGKGVNHRSPTSIFTIRHHNTLVSEEGERDYSVEIELSKVEAKFTELVRRALIEIDANKCPKLSPAERSFLSRYTELQWRRSPDFENAALERKPDQAGAEVFRQELFNSTGVELGRDEAMLLYFYKSGVVELDKPVLDVFRKLVPDEQCTDAELARLIEGDIAERAAKSGRIAARYSKLNELTDIFGDSKEWWVKLPPNLSFVLGSNPVVVLPSKQQKVVHPLNGLVFPVSSGTALVYGNKTLHYKLEIMSDRATVRKLNELIVKQSNSFGSRSLALSKSLMGR